ncbi:biotin--[acetyl-CoA-carboxylase] ligase [Marihabitans asiaticum]|uniref:biotin--[biotin carboxyl-carrier protein] ligase n=1 Tax=Marihabitans asiaticum TaxID=415218 RepID=A0A560WCT9_9MICO|nr:biotin--[acetyl-CoA-carboxylase] ligase [Marihabitans asiaticum]TWD15457.1 BirA family biotin operon repressor/biotin-[acetyl-CoA-carboxylase] ligase [Marihabitans asiaticum]
MTSSPAAQGLRAALRGGRVWGDLVVVDEVGSTNVEVTRLAEPWSVVLARRQTAGRGRRGRSWSDSEGLGLACSMLVPGTPPDDLGWVPLAVGLGVRDCLSGLDLPTSLKWPNDVLADIAGEERKVCGILCEARPGRAKGGPAASPAAGATEVVVGVGVNLDHDRGQLPVETATSLRLLAEEHAVAPPDRAEIAPSLLDAVRDRLEQVGSDSLRSDYRAACATIGRQVVVHRPDGSVLHGVGEDVAPDGRLVVLADGSSATVSAGDVQHVRHR